MSDLFRKLLPLRFASLWLSVRRSAAKSELEGNQMPASNRWKFKSLITWFVIFAQFSFRAMWAALAAKTVVSALLDILGVTKKKVRRNWPFASRRKRFLFPERKVVMPLFCSHSLLLSAKLSNFFVAFRSFPQHRFPMIGYVQYWISSFQTTNIKKFKYWILII